jgi:hypothetical protein
VLFLLLAIRLLVQNINKQELHIIIIIIIITDKSRCNSNPCMFGLQFLCSALALGFSNFTSVFIHDVFTCNGPIILHS